MSIGIATIGMTKEQEMVLLIKGLISELPPASQDEVFRLAVHLREKSKLEMGGHAVGKLAFALVGAELANE